jgi:glycosyltransferase involved in cell wall biosynthesis
MCPSLTLSELPASPPGKNGWPWRGLVLDSEQIMAEGIRWPHLSIITPSFNQGQFIEETIRSVLLQGYPNLQYIIIDGGSTDNSIDTIRKYEPWLDYWVSEKDRGQAHAINKGFDRSSGELLGWINSDDLLLPGSLHRLAISYLKYPLKILLGDTIHISETGRTIRMVNQKNVTLRNMVEIWRHDYYWNQPGTYVSRYLYQQVGHLDETLRYVFDREWMCRLLQIADTSYLKFPVAVFRIHTTSKTVAEGNNWFPEQVVVTRRYWNKVRGLDRNYAEAGLSVFEASIYLSFRYWNRSKGLSLLKTALKHDWRVCMLPKFINLALRALIPASLFRAAYVLRHSLIWARVIPHGLRRRTSLLFSKK